MFGTVVFFFNSSIEESWSKLKNFYDSFDSPKATPDCSEQLWDLPSYPVKRRLYRRLSQFSQFSLGAKKVICNILASIIC